LYYAYADALAAAGRLDEAREWFGRADAADPGSETDAAERLEELDPFLVEDLATPDDKDDKDGEEGEQAPAGSAGEPSGTGQAGAG
jgi:hypothetical protein